MPNHLSVPLKKSYKVNISDVRLDEHPDAYRRDLAQWDSLRARCVAPDTNAFITSVLVTTQNHLLSDVAQLPRSARIRAGKATL